MHTTSGAFGLKHTLERRKITSKGLYVGTEHREGCGNLWMGQLNAARKNIPQTRIDVQLPTFLSCVKGRGSDARGKVYSWCAAKNKTLHNQQLRTRVSRAEDGNLRMLG